MHESLRLVGWGCRFGVGGFGAVGLTLRAMLRNVGPSSGYVGPSWGLCGARLAHLGAMLAHLGAMLAHLAAMLAHIGAMLAHLETYVGPSGGLCWPILAHLEPQDPKNGLAALRPEFQPLLAECWALGRHCAAGNVAQDAALPARKQTQTPSVKDTRCGKKKEQAGSKG